MTDSEQKVVINQTKSAINDYIKGKEAEFYQMGQDSFMHYSAHDIFLLLQEINEHIKTNIN